MGKNKNGTWSDPSAPGSYGDANVKEALAGYGDGHDRQPIGENVAGQVYNGPVGANGPYTTPRGSSPSQATGPAKGNRSPMLVERLGAKYRVEVPMLQTNAPESQLTQANGIVIPPTMQRTEGSFSAGSKD